MRNKINRLAIIHYMPLEFYPPIMNLLNYLAEEQTDLVPTTRVYTCTNRKNRSTFACSGLSIIRFFFPGAKEIALVRLLKYILFNTGTLCSLIRFRPNHLLYYETYSAWPAWFYSKFINRSCRIYIHNHEYASPEWYNTTMRIVKGYHNLENKWLYTKAEWISQTNDDRNLLFCKDNPTIDLKKIFTLPNYPPSIWKRFSAEKRNYTSKPVKCIYIGSLSLENTYLEQFVKWVIDQNGTIIFDIYSYNFKSTVVEFIHQINSKMINLYQGGIEYSDIPFILSKYDVGIIFYKPYSENVINCISNKFFEYAAGNLDIWYSDFMVSTNSHKSLNTKPKVIPIDFANLQAFNLKLALSSGGLKNKPSIYFCEPVYQRLFDVLRK